MKLNINYIELPITIAAQRTTITERICSTFPLVIDTTFAPSGILTKPLLISADWRSVLIHSED